MIGVNGSGKKYSQKHYKNTSQHNRNIRLDDLHVTSEEFNRYDAEFILRQLHLIENRLGLVIPHPYNINLFSHLSFCWDDFAKLGIPLMLKCYMSESSRLRENPEVARIADEIIQNSEQFFNILNYRENEHYYLYQYLVSSRMERNGEEIENQPDKLKLLLVLLLKNEFSSTALFWRKVISCKN